MAAFFFKKNLRVAANYFFLSGARIFLSPTNKKISFLPKKMGFFTGEKKKKKNHSNNKNIVNSMKNVSNNRKRGIKSYEKVLEKKVYEKGIKQYKKGIK